MERCAAFLISCSSTFGSCTTVCTVMCLDLIHPHDACRDFIDVREEPKAIPTALLKEDDTKYCNMLAATRLETCRCQCSAVLVVCPAAKRPTDTCILMQPIQTAGSPTSVARQARHGICTYRGTAASQLHNRDTVGHTYNDAPDQGWQQQHVGI